MRAMARAFFSGNPPVVISSVTFDPASGVIAGTNWGGTVSWTGGVAPFTVSLFSGTVPQYVLKNAASPATLRGAAIKYWDATTMFLKVTDALGNSASSYGQSISVYWIDTGSVTSTSYSPSPGQFVTLTASCSANPSVTSYAWEYRINGGAWTAFGGNSASASSPTMGSTGYYYYFRCTMTNTAGSIISESSLVTVA